MLTNQARGTAVAQVMDILVVQIVVLRVLAVIPRQLVQVAVIAAHQAAQE